MSAIIAQRVFTAGGNQLYLSLLKDEYIRQLSIGNNWNKLSIGLLFSIGSNGNIYGLDWRIGVCTYGTGQNGVYSWNTTNWLGIYFPGTGIDVNTAWTYTAGAGSPYIAATSTTSTCLYIRRTGQTLTSVGGNGATQNWATNNGATSLRRGIVNLQITKGSPNYTLNGSITSSVAQAQTDYTFEQLLEVCSQNTVPGTVGNSAITQIPSGSQLLACDEAAGVLNAISIAWKHSVNPLEIYGIVVYRFS